MLANAVMVRYMHVALNLFLWAAVGSRVLRALEMTLSEPKYMHTLVKAYGLCLEEVCLDCNRSQKLDTERFTQQLNCKVCQAYDSCFHGPLKVVLRR